VEDLDRMVTVVAKRALEEDAAANDITTRSVVGKRRSGRAAIKVRSAGVISGQACARTVFRLLDQSLTYNEVRSDGSRVRPGDCIAGVSGTLRPILSGERTALNLLQHLSGIATLTDLFVERVSGSGVEILDTRKTIPGMRALEKQAVLHGGGRNHRHDLAGLVLVKENHITAAGGLERVLEGLGARLDEAEIEVTSLEELERLRVRPPWRIMLDNFDPGGVREAVMEVRGWQRIPEIEVSGGVTIDTIDQYIIDGVDYISVGSLTSSAPALDMSLTIEEVE
jgi:nicotinate-nucleotide pyrophosphorylase (carboxylating)